MTKFKILHDNEQNIMKNNNQKIFRTKFLGKFCVEKFWKL